MELILTLTFFFYQTCLMTPLCLKKLRARAFVYVKYNVYHSRNYN